LDDSDEEMDSTLNVPSITETFYLKSKYKKEAKSHWQHRTVSSIVTNEPIVVFDFRYLTMHRYKKSAIEAMYDAFDEVLHFNREGSTTPFQIYFCNYNPEVTFHRKLSKRLDFDSNFVTTAPCSYISLFPNERLVYLSRDADQTIYKLDENEIYIIGSIVDNGAEQSFDFCSIKQAEQDKIVTRSLPIDSYFK
jgi:Trm5-related predicted tRNA methylase